ncbi:MAG: extracellular solute-binding protein, partial [Ruminiclostridium sp.]
MKISKRILAAVLSLAAVFSMTACGGDGGAAATTEPTTTSNTLDDDINNPVDVSDILDNQGETKELENPNLTYFGFYDMRVAGDIKPGVKMFEETYGGKIDYQQVAWGDRIDKLLTLIVSDQSPDLVDKEDNSFPHLMSKMAYTDLTDYIDLSQPQWAGYETLVEQYAYGGKHYYYPFSASALNNCLIYNKTLFD